MSSLHTAVRSGDIVDIRACLAEGADINAYTVRGFTPLMIAAEEQYVTIVQLLLSAGADVNLAHVNGRTALHLAAARGYVAIVRVLLEHGAAPDVCSNIGQTAMIEAALYYHQDIVRLLQDYGADPHFRSREGWTADEWLARGGLTGLLGIPVLYQEQVPEREQWADSSAEQTLRRMMASELSPEEYAARHGRRIVVYSYGAYRFADPAMELWAHRLSEILFTPGLLDRCEEEYLSGEELAEVRRFEP